MVECCNVNVYRVLAMDGKAVFVGADKLLQRFIILNSFLAK